MSTNIEALKPIQPIIAAAIAKGSINASGIRFCLNGYAEPGYRNPESGIIAIGEWYDMKELASILEEEHGVELEWPGHFAHCHQCGRLVRICPDGFTWEPFYTIQGGQIICGNCLPIP